MNVSRDVGGRPCRVVVCDDVADFRLLLVAALSRASDIEVVAEAADGAEAIAVVASMQPDVVLLDLSMPVMDGIAALPGILAAAPQTKVIVLTGFRSDTMRARALEAGAADYLEKGVHPSAVLEAVRSMCAT